MLSLYLKGSNSLLQKALWVRPPAAIPLVTADMLTPQLATVLQQKFKAATSFSEQPRLLTKQLKSQHTLLPPCYTDSIRHYSEIQQIISKDLSFEDCFETRRKGQTSKSGIT